MVWWFQFLFLPISSQYTHPSSKICVHRFPIWKSGLAAVIRGPHPLFFLLSFTDSPVLSVHKCAPTVPVCALSRQACVLSVPAWILSGYACALCVRGYCLCTCASCPRMHERCPGTRVHCLCLPVFLGGPCAPLRAVSTCSLPFLLSSIQLCSPPCVSTLSLFP